MMITEIDLVEDVFIERLETKYAGGAGDIAYSIALTKVKEIVMRTMPPASLPPASAGSAAAQSDAAAGKKYGTVRLNNKNSNLNVRKGAGTKYAIIGKLKHGTKVELLKKSGSWYQIPYKSGKGWVYGSYIKVISQPSGAGAAKAQAKKSATYTVKSGDSLYKIAKAKLGSGNRYGEIYRLNQSAIDKKNKGKSVDRYTIYPGQVLKLPGK